MLRPRRIFSKWQRGYNCVPHIFTQEVQRDNRIVSVATIEYSHIFYIR